MLIDEGAVRGGIVDNLDDSKIADTAAHIDQHVGERIRRRRTMLGFTQEQLGAALQISYQQIQKYETGSNRISAGRLYQIANRLDVQIGYFFEGLESHAIAASSNGLGNGGARTTIELVRSFNAIPNTAVRAAVTSLVKSLSAQENRGDERADDASAFGEFASVPGNKST
jgi:transcriptional regulator with XRE-family HTH domain